MIDYAWVLVRKYSDVQWSIGDTYDTLDWQSDTPKPSQKELDDAYPVLLAKDAQVVAAKVAAHGSAVAKLKQLGLTVDEITSIVG